MWRGIIYLLAKMESKQETKQNIEEERIVRILSKDIEGKNKMYSGLTKINGVSWGFANTICRALNIDKKRKIGSLTKEEVTKISEFVKTKTVPTATIAVKVMRPPVLNDP